MSRLDNQTVEAILKLIHDPVIQGAVVAVTAYIANRARKDIAKLKNGAGDRKVDERLRYHNLLPPVQSEPEEETSAIQRLQRAYSVLRGDAKPNE